FFPFSFPPLLFFSLLLSFFFPSFSFLYFFFFSSTVSLSFLLSPPALPLFFSVFLTPLFPPTPFPLASTPSFL
ncbi:hypothetical protein, partial [Staphylococcus aureus]